MYNFPVLLYIYSGMRKAMMEIRRMLVTVAASFMGGHASLLPDRHDDAYGVYHHANEHGCE